MKIAKLRNLAKVVAESPVDMGKWTCGSAACINGWNMRLEGLIGEKNGWTEKGRKLLTKLVGNPWYSNMGSGPQHSNCTYATEEIQQLGEHTLSLSSDEVDRLFYEENWPESFRNLYDNAPKHMRGPITAARIEHFIQTDGTE